MANKVPRARLKKSPLRPSGHGLQYKVDCQSDGGLKERSPFSKGGQDSWAYSEVKYQWIGLMKDYDCFNSVILNKCFHSFYLNYFKWAHITSNNYFISYFPINFYLILTHK